MHFSKIFVKIILIYILFGVVFMSINTQTLQNELIPVPNVLSKIFLEYLPTDELNYLFLKNVHQQEISEISSNAPLTMQASIQQVNDDIEATHTWIVNAVPLLRSTQATREIGDKLQSSTPETNQTTSVLSERKATLLTLKNNVFEAVSQLSQAELDRLPAISSEINKLLVFKYPIYSIGNRLSVSSLNEYELDIIINLASLSDDKDRLFRLIRDKVLELTFERIHPLIEAFKRVIEAQPLQLNALEDVDHFSKIQAAWKDIETCLAPMFLFISSPTIVGESNLSGGFFNNGLSFYAYFSSFLQKITRVLLQNESQLRNLWSIIRLESDNLDKCMRARYLMDMHYARIQPILKRIVEFSLPLPCTPPDILDFVTMCAELHAKHGHINEVYAIRPLCPDPISDQCLEKIVEALLMQNDYQQAVTMFNSLQNLDAKRKLLPFFVKYSLEDSQIFEALSFVSGLDPALQSSKDSLLLLIIEKLLEKSEDIDEAVALIATLRVEYMVAGATLLFNKLLLDEDMDNAEITFKLLRAVPRVNASRRLVEYYMGKKNPAKAFSYFTIFENGIKEYRGTLDSSESATYTEYLRETSLDIARLFAAEKDFTRAYTIIANSNREYPSWIIQIPNNLITADNVQEGFETLQTIDCLNTYPLLKAKITWQIAIVLFEKRRFREAFTAYACSETIWDSERDQNTIGIYVEREISRLKEERKFQDLVDLLKLIPNWPRRQTWLTDLIDYFTRQGGLNQELEELKILQGTSQTPTAPESIPQPASASEPVQEVPTTENGELNQELETPKIIPESNQAPTAPESIPQLPAPAPEPVQEVPTTVNETMLTNDSGQPSQGPNQDSFLQSEVSNSTNIDRMIFPPPPLETIIQPTKSKPHTIRIIDRAILKYLFSTFKHVCLMIVSFVKRIFNALGQIQKGVWTSARTSLRSNS